MRLLVCIIARLILLLAILVAPSLFARQVRVDVYNGWNNGYDVGAGKPGSSYMKVRDADTLSEPDMWVPHGATATIYVQSDIDGYVTIYADYGGWSSPHVPEGYMVHIVMNAQNGGHLRWIVPDPAYQASSGGGGSAIPDWFYGFLVGAFIIWCLVTAFKK